MRLLLDEMYPRAIAEQLRERGHDAVAVVERLELRRQADRELFERAHAQGRAVVTENIRDFVPLAREYAGQGQAHHGLVLVEAVRYPRGNRRTVGRMVRALDELLRAHPGADATGLVAFL